MGIEQERIPQLFKLFGELKHNIQMKSENELKDNNIGVGLYCSEIIAQALNGDVEFIPQSEKKTSVSITLPVKIYEEAENNSDKS